MKHIELFIKIFVSESGTGSSCPNLELDLQPKKMRSDGSKLLLRLAKCLSLQVRF